MSEPASGTGAAAFAGWKLIGGLAGLGAIGAGLAALVVMCMTPPRSAKEWTVGLTSTVMGSVAGGSAVVQYLGIQRWAEDVFGMTALIGVVFACGLPAWAIVRWTFNFIQKREGKSIDQVAGDLRDVVRGGK